MSSHRDETGRGSMGRRPALRVLAAALGASALTLLPRTFVGAAPVRRVEHPTPREGITAEKVLPEGEIPERSRPAYRAAREIPQVLDGLYCHCDCAERDKLRSLLSCFETRMPTSCGYCREEAVLALAMHRDGKTLDEIRAAVDKEFGS